MRQLLLALLLGLAASTSAQITIGEDDMPNANDTLRYRTTIATGVDVALTGAGITWDFGQLNPMLEAADTTVSVSATPLLYQLYFNNPFLYPQNRADYGVKGTDFDFQAITLTDVYDYYRADANGFFNVGFGANVNGLPTSVRRQPTDRVHQFPMNYGNEEISASAFNLNIPGLFYFGQDQVRSNEVDGWGTLYLPADTFAVLRVKSTIQRSDTIYIQQLGTGFRLPEPETIEYKWIAAGMGKPVLEVITVGGIATTAEFFYGPDDITTAVNTLRMEGPQVYPNPARNEVFVPVAMDGHLILRDATGRAVLERNVRAGSLERVELVSLANGTYAVEIAGQDAIARSTVVVQR
ncbi:MAG: T9SS type A sorting domain-containing protein [Flavobacteriales bacterium]